MGQEARTRGRERRDAQLKVLGCSGGGSEGASGRSRRKRRK